MRLYVLCAMTLAACAFEPTGPYDPGDEGTPDPGIPSDVDAGFVGEPPVDPTPPEPLPPPTVQCRLDGANLGIVGAVVRFGNRSYTFAAWETSASGEPIGFTLTGPANVRYEVRTDGDRQMVESLVYQGTDRITRVDFCVDFDD